MKIGIDQLHLYSSHYYVDLKTLATERGVDVDKFTNGIVSYNPKFFEEFKGTSTQNDENGIR